ncbi:MAG: hypothetical protein ACRDKS_09550 [Actinomycetota bacterium]
MRKTIVSIALGAMIAALVLSVGSSSAATRCETVPNLGLLCVTTPPGGIEVFRSSDHSYSRVHGVGVECFNGHYYLQYQLGSPDTYRPVPLFDLGTDCPVFS